MDGQSILKMANFIFGNVLVLGVVVFTILLLQRALPARQEPICYAIYLYLIVLFTVTLTALYVRVFRAFSTKLN
jgi:hypothetical protein